MYKIYFKIPFQLEDVQMHFDKVIHFYNHWGILNWIGISNWCVLMELLEPPVAILVTRLRVVLRLTPVIWLWTVTNVSSEAGTLGHSAPGHTGTMVTSNTLLHSRTLVSQLRTDHSDVFRTEASNNGKNVEKSASGIFEFNIS